MRHVLYFFAWLRSRLMSDKSVEEKYLFEGGVFGDVVSYGYLGECVGLERFLDVWERWEYIYAARGYRTIPLKQFVEYGGGFRACCDGIGVKRAGGEAPVYHAQEYRNKHLGKMDPVVDLSKNEIQRGEWIPPYDTKELN